MDFAYVPNFITDLPDVEIFRRLEVFTNLCIKLTSKLHLGEDNSVKTMNSLLKYPPLTGLPVMNGVLDLLKDVVFAYQAVKLTGSSQTDCSQDLDLKQGTDKKFKMFPSQVKSEVKTLHKALTAAVTEHKYVIRKLTDVHLAYVQQYELLQFLVRQFKERQAKPVACKSDATKQHMRKNKNVIDKDILKLRRENEQQDDKTTKALARRIVFKQRESQLREGKLREIESKLSILIKERITEALSLGHRHLEEFGRQVSFPQVEMDKLDQFDVDFLASKIYKQMSTRYVFPAIEYFGHGATIPGCRFEYPDLSIQSKHDIRLGKSGSCVDLLNEAPYEMRREELYVWACYSTGNTVAKGQTSDVFLRLDKGDKVKQKFCSDNGTLGFGWKRRMSGGFKTYGFYPTHSVHLVA